MYVCVIFICILYVISYGIFFINTIHNGMWCHTYTCNAHALSMKSLQTPSGATTVAWSAFSTWAMNGSNGLSATGGLGRWGWGCRSGWHQAWQQHPWGGCARIARGPCTVVCSCPTTGSGYLQHVLHLCPPPARIYCFGKVEGVVYHWGGGLLIR